MSKTAIGARVGAILSADDEEVRLLGYGVYDGEHEPPFGPMGATKEEYEEVISEMKAQGQLPDNWECFKNPRIMLDDGRVVWGAQCWWGPESVVRSRIGTRRVVMAKLDD
jgi:hypothetical protein